MGQNLGILRQILIAPPPHFHVFRFVFPHGGRLAGEVGKCQQQRLDPSFEFFLLGFELSELRFDLVSFFFERGDFFPFGIAAGFNFLPNEFADFVTARLEFRASGFELPLLLLETGDLDRVVTRTAQVEARLHRFWIFANLFEI